MELDAHIANLEAQLNDFNPHIRASALAELKSLAERGYISGTPPLEVVNMHCHTFFSFNAYGYSPSGLAWLAWRRGFRVVGIVDFDVLDGVEEFLTACEELSIRGTAGLETRVFIPQFATREINSPGEPGISYHMGIGFTSGQVPSEASDVLAHMRRLVRQRNLDIISRVNAYLAPVMIDYERDVLPLTPAGNPTERHIVVAYVHAAERSTPDPAVFWSERLDMPVDQVRDMIGDPARFQNTIRAKLMKQGGVGYVPPTHEAFPTVSEVHRLILACGALPCAAWLDGFSAGEQSIDELLHLLMDQGVVALNIIPDRNWNISDSELRRVKVQKLWEIVQRAQELALPLNIGTEMNAFGQKLVDDFDVPEMQPLRRSFLDGAHFVWGHTMLQRALGLGYQSNWARLHLPDRRMRNDFYTQVGYLIPPGKTGLERLRCIGVTTPEQLLTKLKSEQV
ncbi:MAG: hypothetical protein ACUVSF_12955 [Anaerolineae bacterium]